MAPAARLRASNASTSGSSATRAFWRPSMSVTSLYGPFLRGASAYPAICASSPAVHARSCCGLMSCSPSSVARASTSSTVVSSVSGTSDMSPVHAVTTVAACPQHMAGPRTPAPGSTPMRRPCSATRDAA